jgi:hypothetical protein
MISSSFSLLLLRELPFTHFNFPRWQSLVAISLIGMLVGLDPSFRAAPPNMPVPPMWLAVVIGLVVVWLTFLVNIVVLRWWMKRGGRWDGQGDLFNLVAAAWLVANVLGAGLVALGVPGLLTVPLWLYSVWVGGNALSGAVPRASLAYSIGGIVIGLVPALLVSGLVMGVVMAALAMLGAAPAAAGA